MQMRLWSSQRRCVECVVVHWRDMHTQLACGGVACVALVCGTVHATPDILRGDLLGEGARPAGSKQR